MPAPLQWSLVKSRALHRGRVESLGSSIDPGHKIAGYYTKWWNFVVLIYPRNKTGRSSYRCDLGVLPGTKGIELSSSIMQKLLSSSKPQGGEVDKYY
jgi:hypothetical protein